MAKSHYERQKDYIARKKAARGPTEPGKPQPESMTPEKARWARARRAAHAEGREFEHEDNPPYNTYESLERAQRSFAAHPANTSGAELTNPDPVPRKNAGGGTGRPKLIGPPKPKLIGPPKPTLPRASGTYSSKGSEQQATYIARKKAARGPTEPGQPQPETMTPEKQRWSRARQAAHAEGRVFEHEDNPPYHNYGLLERAQRSFAAHPANTTGAELQNPDPVPRKNARGTGGRTPSEIGSHLGPQFSDPESGTR